MKREDILKVDELKAELSDAFRTFERRMTGVIGELVYGIDTVIDQFNTLERRHAILETQHEALDVQQRQLQQQLNAVSQRLLLLERDISDQ